MACLQLEMSCPSNSCDKTGISMYKGHQAHKVFVIIMIYIQFWLAPPPLVKVVRSNCNAIEEKFQILGTLFTPVY